MRAIRYGNLLGATLLALAATHARATPVDATSPPGQAPAPRAVLAAGGNLVANGGFETGAYAPEWTRVSGDNSASVCKSGDPIGFTTCKVATGQYAMSFDGLTGAVILQQNLATVPGQKYILEFQLAIDNPAPALGEGFSVSWNGAGVYSLPSPQPSFPFNKVTLTVQATSASTPLSFSASPALARWFVDDVSVALPAAAAQAAPVPALDGKAIALLALLVAGAAAWRVRRSR